MKFWKGAFFWGFFSFSRWHYWYSGTEDLRVGWVLLQVCEQSSYGPDLPPTLLVSSTVTPIYRQMLGSCDHITSWCTIFQSRQWEWEAEVVDPQTWVGNRRIQFQKNKIFQGTCFTRPLLKLLISVNDSNWHNANVVGNKYLRNKIA